MFALCPRPPALCPLTLRPPWPFCLSCSGMENKNKTKLDDDKPSFGHCCAPRTWSTCGNVETFSVSMGNKCCLISLHISASVIHLLLHKLPNNGSHSSSSVVNELSLYFCHLYLLFQTFHCSSSSSCLNHCWINERCVCSMSWMHVFEYVALGFCCHVLLCLDGRKS